MTEEERLRFLAKEYEKKLKELMPEEEWRKFITGVARAGFRKEIKESPNEEFKKMVFDNWEDITR